MPTDIERFQKRNEERALAEAAKKLDAEKLEAKAKEEQAKAEAEHARGVAMKVISGENDLRTEFVKLLLTNHGPQGGDLRDFAEAVFNAADALAREDTKRRHVAMEAGAKLVGQEMSPAMAHIANWIDRA